MPFENAQRFRDLMESAGNRCQLEAFDGLGHGFFNGAFFRKKAVDPVPYQRTMELSAAFLTSLGFLPSEPAPEAPNVILIVTDDQGYGDLSCHGNPVLETPHLDALHSESTRLLDYHVAPTCSPTRSALLTGHWTNRTGVWHTINGRSMLRRDEVTVGDLFSAAGYSTAMFGKWHLGDNAPFRPEDRGFGEVLRHGGGGVGQTPDVWDNAYFDGSYFKNGVPTPVEGYCTDVFFDAAMDFMKSEKAAARPFFAYIATNAPHGPFHAPEGKAKPFLEAGLPLAVAHFLGMISNIDDNVGELRAFLEKEGLAENTILIFTTDNGTAAGESVFNAGMRGKKGSAFDGGHRVPFFLHWPKGGFDVGRDVAPIAAHVDVVPTLLDLAQVPAPEDLQFDGRSVAPLLQGEIPNAWPDRILVTDSQRVKDPIPWRRSAVMTSDWRLVTHVSEDGTPAHELFAIHGDPAQKDNVFDAHPAVTSRRRRPWLLP